MVLPGGSSVAPGAIGAGGSASNWRGGRRGGGGGSSRPAPTPNVSVNGNTVTINGQGFSVAPELQASFIKSQTGGVGASAQQAIARAEALEKQRLAQVEAQRQAAAEKLRIENLRRAILQKGAQERQRLLRNQKGEQVRQTITEIKQIKKGVPTNALVWKYENLDTGEVRYRAYEAPKAGGGRKLSGGVDFGQQSATQVKEISKELTDAGLKPIIEKGQVVGFKDKTTLRNYEYSDKGIRQYNQAQKDRSKMLDLSSKDTLRRFGKVSNVIQSAVAKGDSFYNKTTTKIADNVVKGLKKSGVPVTKINSDLKRYIKKSETYLKRVGLDKASFEKYRDNINKQKTKLGLRLKSDELSKAKLDLKSNTYQLKKNRNFEENVDYFLTKASVYSNIIAFHTAGFLIDIGLATPELLRQLKNAPLATIASLPPAVIQGVKQDWKRVRTGGAVGIGEVVVEYYSLGKLLKLPGFTKKTIEKALPRTVKLKDNKIKLKRSIVETIKRKKPIELKLQTVASGSMNFAKQFKEFSGKQITAVNASADALTSLIRRKKLIRKPFNLTGLEKRFPKGEASFPLRIRKLLNKFDSGKKLTTKEFIEVNSWLQKNIAPNITLLERSLYLDPSSGLRKSRLGQLKEPKITLRDIIKGNVRFDFRILPKGSKPQILVFETDKVAKTPKYIQQIVDRIDKRGINYKGFDVDLAKLVKWQTKTGDRLFKPGGSPIYAGGRELEVTLAPGEYIKRVKQLGRVFVDGKKVTIVSAKIYKPSVKVARQIKLANAGKLSAKELVKLEKFMSKQLGRKIKIETPRSSKRLLGKELRRERRINSNVPTIRVAPKGLVVVGRARSLTTSRRVSPRRISRPSRRDVARRKVNGRRKQRKDSRRGKMRMERPKRPTGKRITRRNVRQTPKRPIQRRTAKRLSAKRLTKKQKKIRPVIAENFKRETLRKSIPTYFVVEKVRGKFKKLFPKPLSVKDAKDYAVYSIDNRLSRTAFFIPLGKAKTVVRPPKNIQGYSSRNSQKVRPYRIRYGKKKLLVNGYIEKRRFFSDTVGEKRQLRTARRISPARRRQLIKQLQKARAKRMGKNGPTKRKSRQIRKSVQRKSQRKISSSQRKELLKRLAKARAVRMKMIKKKKR